MVAASEGRGSRRIKDGRAQHSRQLVLDLQLAILGLRRVICCLIEALVDYLGTGPGFVRGYRTPTRSYTSVKNISRRGAVPLMYFGSFSFGYINFFDLDSTQWSFSFL